MTKEELAKKKGLVITKENKTPAEKLVTTMTVAPKEPVVVVEPAPVTYTEVKRNVGKPKKRRAGDKKTSFWIDADLVDKLYSRLQYGDSAGELINKALREYLK